jgi:hypothetical protein
VLEPPLQLRYPEQNANFIEVAIPFDQLGGLRPGGTIKLAAVAGLGGYDTNAQTRELDTSYLGASMLGAGKSNVVLGAVSVQLAPALLTVRANDQTRPYGTSNAPLTVTYNGFIGGDGPDVLTGSPALSTLAETNSPIGAYPIEVSQASLSNACYAFSFINGTLTIIPASTTIALISSQNPSTNGNSTRFTATVSPVAPATGIPTGIVTFRTNGGFLATIGLSGGQGSIFTEFLPPGLNVVQVEYVGDGNFLGSTDSVQQMVEPVQTPPGGSTSYVLSMAQTMSNIFTITLLGATNAQYYLLTATELGVPMTNWTVLADSTNTATNGVWYYTGTAEMLGDNSTNGGMRFFRTKAVNPYP